jgi:acetyl/propionyl-CoA carboxylase alpha subunit
MTPPTPAPTPAPITALLVANRGEIARRIMRTAKAMDIRCVAVFADPDADAPFVREADEAVRLPGAAPAETYLDIDRIIAAAKATGADAVHPGYGFLSENAAFARACTEAGLTFVGPSAEAIERMGSKIAAKEIMAAAGVPVLPSITVTGDSGIDAAQVGQEIGYPVLVKAAFGGGGRGMRIVTGAAALSSAVDSARREAASAFGDGTVFLEHYVSSPRHIEVQIFGDGHGTVVPLFERECSIQRRYQKIIEEAPSPVVTDELRRELCTTAVAAAKAIDYVGAGTVEFVLDARGRFHFLEMNTRLQVEHPVTELVTGLDLVRLQLLVAEGHPLPPEVHAARIDGHAIEARLYAEDVPAGFLPATGVVHRFDAPALPGVRVDGGIVDGSVVGVHYDPMLAKVIAHAPARDEACRLLARALAETRVHGVVTNRDLLVGILREPEFRAGDIDTGYLTRHDPAGLAAPARDPRAAGTHVLAAALAAQAHRRATARVLGAVPSGWRNVPDAAQTAEFTLDGTTLAVGYRLTPAGLTATVDGEPVDALLWSATATEVDLEVDGVRRTIAVDRIGDVSHVDSALGATALVEVPRFTEPGDRAAPGSLLAPMPGTVVRLLVEQGDTVVAGAPVVVLEAMKMEHTVVAPAAGEVGEIGVRVGQAVDLGAVLAVVGTP